MNTRCLSAILAVVFLAAGLPSVANATLADDYTAIISDSVSISRTTNPKFFAHIDYAVYAPGEYPGSLTFPAGKYVYCYQLFNDSTSTSNITSLTINLDTASIAYNPYYDVASGSGVSGGITLPGTTNPSVNSSAISYNFGNRDNTILANHYSVVLLFMSDYAPDTIMGTGHLDTNAGSFSVQLPVPTPEPASLLILALAAPALSLSNGPALLKTSRRKS